MYKNYYGKVEREEVDESHLAEAQNDIVFSNLLMAASNPKVMEEMEPSDRQALIRLLTAYAETNVERIIHSGNPDARELQRRMGMVI